MWNSHCADFNIVGPPHLELKSLGGSAGCLQYLLASKWHLEQALHFAIHAYIEEYSCPGGDKANSKRAKMAVREEVLKLLWPHADLETPSNLDTMLIAHLKSFGLPKSLEVDLLSQLSNGQKKMCEHKLRSFIKSPIFDKLVENQLPCYLKAVQEEPSKFSAWSDEIVRKLRHASSLLAEPQNMPASGGGHFGHQAPPVDNQSPRVDRFAPRCVVAEKSDNVKAEEVHLLVPELCVKNTFLDVRDEVQEDQMQAKSCFAGCWTHHAHQKNVHEGRAGSFAEVASHQDNQSITKWDYHKAGHSEWTGDKQELKQASKAQASMSRGLLIQVIDTLQDHSENVAEVAEHISSSVQALDDKTKKKAVAHLKACVGQNLGENDCEKVLRALAACTMLEFLDHSLVLDRSGTQSIVVANIFAEQLCSSQFAENQLSELMRIVILHWSQQDEAGDMIVNSCMNKILEVHQVRDVILGINTRTGQAASLLSDEDHAGINHLLQKPITPKRWHSCTRLFVRMRQLPQVVEFLVAIDRPDGLELALEEIIEGFDRIAHMLLDTYDKCTPLEKDMARKIISEALQHDLAKQSVDLHKWICKSVSSLHRFDMKKRFFIFGLLLGETDLWQLIEGHFHHSNGPKEDMLSAALSIYQELVPFRRDSSSRGTQVASKRVEVLLTIESAASQQNGNAFDSNLACCIGLLVNDVSELSNDLPERICKKLMLLMADTSDAGVLHACCWALSQLFSKWSIDDEALRREVSEQCRGIQDLFMSEAQAYQETVKILEKCSVP